MHVKTWNIIFIIFCLIFTLQNERILASVFISLFCSIFIFRYFYISPKLAVIVIFAFLVRLAFIMLDEKFNLYSYALDSTHYNIISSQIILNYQHNLPLYYNIDPSFALRSYGLFISMYYYFLGNYQVIIRIINAFIGVLSIIQVFYITKYLFNNLNIQLRTTLMVSFYPSFILFSCLNLRDALITLLSLYFIYLFIAFKKNNRFRVFSCTLLYIIIGLFRPQNFILFALFFIIYYLWVYVFQGQSKLYVFMALLFIMSIIAIVYIIFNDFINEYIEYPLRALPRRAIGGSAYLTEMEYQSLIDVILQSPIRFVYFTFGPFLWDVRNSFMLIAFLETFFIIPVMYFSYKFFSKNKKILNRSDVLFLFVFGLVGLIANATVDSNYGTAIRHRIIYILPFIIFASAYLENIRFCLFTKDSN